MGAEAFEIDAQKRSDVSRMAIMAKGHEVALQEEAGVGAETFLIRSGEEEYAARSQESVEFAEERMGIFQITDDFGANDGGKGLRRKRKRSIEVGHDPRDVARERVRFGQEIDAGKRRVVR